MKYRLKKKRGLLDKRIYKKDVRRNMDVFAIEAETAMDLRVKERLRLLYDAKARHKNLCFNGKGSNTESCTFNLMFNELQGECSDFAWNAVDVYGSDRYGISDVFKSLSDYPDDDGLCYDEVSSIFHFFINEEMGSSSIKEEDVEEYVMWISDGGQADDRRSLVRGFIQAVIDAENGKIEEALMNDDFYSFCRDLGEFLNPVYEDMGAELIANAPKIAFYCFAEGYEECTVRSGVYCSEEVALYDSYKDSLPPNIRAEADAYISVFRDPGMCESHSFYLNGYCWVFYTVQKDSEIRPGMEEAEFNALFENAVRYINGNLKELRKEYGNAYDSELLCAA